MANPFEKTFKIGRGKPTPKPPQVTPPTPKPKPESKLSKNPLVREIRRQGGKVRELAEKPGQETFRQEVLRQPRYPKQLPENFSTYQVLVQEFDDLDNQVLGFSTAGDINAVPEKMRSNPQFQEYWAKRGEMKKGRQQQLDNKRATMETVATMEQNRQAGMERENLTPEESDMVKESISLPGNVGQDLAYGFSREPGMAGKSNASLAADSLIYALPDFLGGNMSELALRANNPNKALDEIDAGSKATQQAFNFGASLVGAAVTGGSNLALRGAAVGSGVAAGKVANGFGKLFKGVRTAENAAKIADLSTRLGIDVVKAGKFGGTAGRFTLLELPGYAKMVTDNNGDVVKAAKMFWDSTFGQWAKLDELIDPNTPADQKMAMVTGMIGSLLIGVGTVHGGVKGYDHVRNRFVNEGSKGLGSAFDPTFTPRELENYDPGEIPNLVEMATGNPPVEKIGVRVLDDPNFIATDVDPGEKIPLLGATPARLKGQPVEIDVYHGTGNPDIDVVNIPKIESGKPHTTASLGVAPHIGAYFTDSEQTANGYAIGNSERSKDTGTVLSGRLVFKNAIDLGNLTDEQIDLFDAMYSGGRNNDSFREHYLNLYQDPDKQFQASQMSAGNRALQFIGGDRGRYYDPAVHNALLRSLGIDGLYLKTPDDSPSIQRGDYEYIALTPESAKLVTNRSKADSNYYKRRIPQGVDPKTIGDYTIDTRAPKPVDAKTAVDTLLGKGNLSRIEALSPDDIEVDPRMQHRPGGTNKVGDGTPFNITQADKITVFRTKDGRNIVADGHHRLEIAKNAAEFLKQEPDGRVSPADRTVLSEILDESDGWTFEQAQNMAAVRNMVGGTISPYEAALAVNRMGLDIDALAKQGLKPHHTMAKEVQGLLKLDPALLEELNDTVLGLNRNGNASRFAAAIGNVDGLTPALQREALKNALSDRSRATSEADAIQIANDVKNGAMSKAVATTQMDMFGDSADPEVVIDVPYDIMNSIRKGVRDTVRAQYANIVAKLKGDTRGGEVIDTASRQADKANLGGSQDKAVGRATQAMTSGMWNGGRNPIEAMIGDVAKKVDSGEMTMDQAVQSVLDRVLPEITGSDKQVMDRQMKAPDVSRETSSIDDLPDSNVMEAQGGLGLFSLGGNAVPPVTRVGTSTIENQTGKRPNKKGGMEDKPQGRAWFLQGLTQLQDQLGVNGEVVRPGALTRVFGETGTKLSRALFDASKRNIDFRAPYVKMLNLVDEALSLETKDRGGNVFKRNKSFEEVQREFVDIAELEYNDPKRIAVKASQTNMGEALRQHDALTQGVKRMIVQGKILDGSIKIVDANGDPVKPAVAAADDAMVDAATDDYGITDRGYFHHTWLGDTSVYVKDASGKLTVVEEGLKTYLDAERVATEYANNNPGSSIIIKGRDRYSTSRDFRPEVSRGRFFGSVAKARNQIINDLRSSGVYSTITNNGNVTINFNDIAKDMVGSVVTIGKPRKKFNKATMTRDTALNPLGKQGYSKDYRAVMDSYIANSARSRNLTQLSAEIKPIIDSIKKSGEWNDKAKRAIEVFEDKVIGDIWGTPTRVDDAISDLLEKSGLDRFVANPATWATSFGSALTSLQYTARLRFNPKQWAMNGQQTLQLIPDVGAKAYKAATQEVAESYAGKNSTVKDLKDRGVLAASVHAEDVNPFRKGWKSTDFNATVSEYNRAVGYVIGRNKAMEAGITDPELIHDSGLQWATRAEGDASVYNKPVAFRGPGAKVATQFKSFTVHQLRDIFQMQEGESKAEFQKRALKKLGIIWAGGGTKALSPSATKFITAYAMFKLSEKMTEADIDDERQDQLFAILHHGLPSMMGVDLSSSLSVVDTFGDNVAEVFGNTIGGPLLGTISGAVDKSIKKQPVEDAATPYSKMGRAILGKEEFDSPGDRLLQALNIPTLKKSIGYSKKDAKKGGEFVNAVLKPFKLSIDPDVEKRKKREVRAKREKRETR